MKPTTHHASLFVALLLAVSVACGEVAVGTVDQGAASPPSSATPGIGGSAGGTSPGGGEGAHAGRDVGRGGSHAHAAGHSSGSSGTGGQGAAKGGASGAAADDAGGAAGHAGDPSGHAGSADQPGGSAGAPAVGGGAGQGAGGAGDAAAGGAGSPIDVGGGAAGSGGQAIEPGSFACTDIHWPSPPALDVYVRVVGKAPLIDGVPAARIVARWRMVLSEEDPYTYSAVYAHAFLPPDGSFDLGAPTPPGQYELTLVAEPASGEAWKLELGVDRVTPPLAVLAGSQGDVTNVVPEAFTGTEAWLDCTPKEPPGVRIPGKK